MLASQQKHDGQETRKILTLHFLQKMDYETIGKIMCVPSEEVSSCCANFAKNFSNEASIMEVINSLDRQQRPQGMQGADTDEVRELRRRLKEAEIRAEAYEEMIKIAEARFNIPIRKKAGAKQ